MILFDKTCIFILIFSIYTFLSTKLRRRIVIYSSCANYINNYKTFYK